MCGIAGLFDLQGQREPNRDLLASMTASLRHRGPDADGLFAVPGVGLGHRRLSIIDLEGGSQPLFNEDGSVVVVFNGEIYNFPELMEVLEGLGHLFRTRSDTEVLVHAWEEWGRECVHRLRGMFAFALLDRRNKTLFLARDRLGIKPLYYALLPDGWLAFASELKGILHSKEFVRVLEPRAVELYFSLGYVPDPFTIFKNAHKLEPAHHLTLIQGEPLAKSQSYWDLTFSEGGTVLREEDAAEALIQRVRESVQVHMNADVSLGSFLSGGVDSSAVTAIMASLSEKPVTACSVSFGEGAFDESNYAIQVANQFGVDHHLEQASADHYHLIDTLSHCYDEPFADSSSLPTWLVCRLARKHVKVALSGDGGDEMLGGYERYRFFMAEERVRSMAPDWLRLSLFGPLGWLYPKMDRFPRYLRAKSTFQSLAKDSVAGYLHGVSIMTDSQRLKLFSRSFKKELQGFSTVSLFRDHARLSSKHPLSLVHYLDLKTFLPGRILTKVDRASMAHGLEVRVPILDHLLVEWMAQLPPDLKLKQGVGKYIFKKGLRTFLPDELLYRPKMGFSIPLATWLRGPLREHTRKALLGPELEETGVFNGKFIHHMVNRHQSGAQDFSSPLWALLMFESFLRTTLRG